MLILPSLRYVEYLIDIIHVHVSDIIIWFSKISEKMHYTMANDTIIVICMNDVEHNYSVRSLSVSDVSEVLLPLPSTEPSSLEVESEKTLF